MLDEVPPSDCTPNFSWPPASVALNSDPTPITGFVPSLVMRLLKGLEQRGHCVWMDNFYNSPALTRTLKSIGFDVVGTLRPDRMLVPPILKQLKVGTIPMKQGELYGCTSGDIDLFVWRDVRRVAFVTTYHGLAVHRCPIERKSKPIIVRDYNVCMSGIDKKDQLLSGYPMERTRTMIWYKKFFRRTLYFSVHNAWILHNKSPCALKQLKNREFREELVEEILKRHRRQESGYLYLSPTR